MKPETEESISEQEGELSRWLVPYGNMMTILMVFFLILYAFTYWIGDVNYERVIMSIQKDLIKFDEEMLEKIKSKEKETIVAIDLSKKFEETGLSGFANVQINAQLIRISLASPILFELGSADIKPEAKIMLKTVAEAIKDLPNKVIIEGHTCNKPIFGGKYRSNWELSIARAVSVINYLVKEENIPPERFIAAGYGEFRPLYPNTTESNRAKNRRVEIVLIRT